MKKILMHKDTPVCSFILSVSGKIGNVKVINNDLFPWSGQSETSCLKRWMLLRKTSPNRHDLAQIAGFYGPIIKNTDNLCSLFDCYWVKDEEDHYSWDDISPFNCNDFTQDGLYLSVVKPRKFVKFTENSPNLTIPGVQPLFWHIEDGYTGLINSDAQLDMSLYKLAQKEGIDIFKKRKYIIISNIIYTFKKTETSPQIERIPFDQLFLETEDRNFSMTENLKRCCLKNEIPDWEDFIRKLIQFNKLSEDKKIELSDIGVLRDSDSLKYIGFDKL